MAKAETQAQSNPHLFFIQHDDEKVIKIIRRSLVTELPWVLVSITLVTILLFIAVNENLIFNSPDLSNFINILKRVVNEDME